MAGRLTNLPKFSLRTTFPHVPRIAWLLFAVPAVLLLIQLVILFDLNSEYPTSVLMPSRFHQRKPTRTVLIWTKEDMSMESIREYIRPKLPRRDCIDQCEFTTNKSALATCHAVIFDTHFASKLPPEGPNSPFHVRKPEQVYIFYSQSTPNEYDVRYEAPKYFFNFTATYRFDSVVHLAVMFLKNFHDRISPRRRFTRHPQVVEMHQKKKFVAMIWQNCSATQSRMEDLVDKIDSYIHVDVFGPCGSPPTRFPPVEESMEEACRGLGVTYKFLLAFEPSLCLGAHSTYPFLALDAGMIPIVYGHAQYHKLLPPNSYIDVMDYSTIQDLVNHLRKLDKDDVEYLKYFEWKRATVLGTGNAFNPFCSICEEISRATTEPERDMMEDAEQWWMTEDDGTSPACLSPEKFV